MGNFIKKENKALAMFLFASLLLLVVIVTILTTSFFKLTELKSVEQSLAAEVEKRGGERQMASSQASDFGTVTIEESGYLAHLREADTKLVVDFFERAFTWSGDAEYEEARAHYTEQLGEGNSFVEVYLGKDKAVFEIQANREAEVNLLEEVDEQNLKSDGVFETEIATKNIAKSNKSLTSKMDAVEIVPLHANRNVIHYIGFITYYIGNEDEVLSKNKTKLNSDTAIVEFSIVDTENGREVDDVEAWIKVE